MPAVVSAESDFIAPRCSSGDPDRHRVGLATPFAEPNHFGTRYQFCQEFSGLQFERMVNTEPGSLSRLVLDGSHDSGISVAEKDRAGSHVEVNVLVTIHVPKIPALLSGTVNRRNAVSVHLGPPTEQVSSSRYELFGAIVELQRLGNSRYTEPGLLFCFRWVHSLCEVNCRSNPSHSEGASSVFEAKWRSLCARSHRTALNSCDLKLTLNSCIYTMYCMQ